MYADLTNVVEFPSCQLRVTLTADEQREVKRLAKEWGVCERTALRRLFVEEARLQLNMDACS